MTEKLLLIGFVASMALNLNLAYTVRRQRRGLQDAARRVRFLGRVLNSHAANRGVSE